MQKDQRLNATQGCGSFHGPQEQFTLLFVGQPGEFVSKMKTRFSPGRSQVFASQILSKQIRDRKEVSPHYAVDQTARRSVTFARGRGQIFTKFSPAQFEVLDQERIALDAGHYSRHDYIT